MAILGKHIKEENFRNYQGTPGPKGTPPAGAGGVGRGKGLTEAQLHGELDKLSEPQTGGAKRQAYEVQLQMILGDLGTAIERGDSKKAQELLGKAKAIVSKLQSLDAGDSKRYANDVRLQMILGDLGTAIKRGNSEKAQVLLGRANAIAQPPGRSALTPEQAKTAKAQLAGMTATGPQLEHFDPQKEPKKLPTFPFNKKMGFFYTTRDGKIHVTVTNPYPTPRGAPVREIDKRITVDNGKAGTFHVKWVPNEDQTGGRFIVTPVTRESADRGTAPRTSRVPGRNFFDIDNPFPREKPKKP